MKHLFLFFSICILGTFCSCSDNDTLGESYGNSKIFLTPDEYISIAYDSNKDLGNNGVLEMVKGFNLTQTSRSTLGETPKITKKYNLTFNFNGKKSKLISVPIYEVKLNGNSNEGYALVSGDERVPAVIAYVDKGTINDTIVNKGAALMIREAKNALFEKVNEIESIKDSLRSATLDKIEPRGEYLCKVADETPSQNEIINAIVNYKGFIIPNGILK